MSKGPSMKTLERQLNILNKQNDALKTNLEVRNKNMANSLFSLVQGAQGQSSLGSFNNLAYFNIYAPITINWTLLTYMYKTHGILQTAIDMPVLDALRGGIEIHSDELDKDDLKDFQDLLENGGILSTIGEAMTWTRLYGGGAIILNTKQDPATPLSVKELNELELYAANRWEIVSPRRFSEYYDFYGTKIHHSRVLTMNGKAAPYLVRWTLQGWGMSEMERMIEDFNIYLRTKDVVYDLLKEAKIDVFQFENFTAQLASSAGTELTKKRVQLMNEFKSYQSAVVMDKNDAFEQKQITFTGLSDIQKQNMIYIASALRMPLTKLFGLSATGFNSGEDDIENYNAMVESEVRQPLRTTIRTVLNLLCVQMFGEEYDLSFTYKPLRIMSSIDEETVNTQKHTRYQADYHDGMLDAQEYAEVLQMEKLLPFETNVAKGAEPEPPMSQMDDSCFGDDKDKEKKDDK